MVELHASGKETTEKERVGGEERELPRGVNEISSASYSTNTHHKGMGVGGHIWVQCKQHLSSPTVCLLDI